MDEIKIKLKKYKKPKKCKNCSNIEEYLNLFNNSYIYNNSITDYFKDFCSQIPGYYYCTVHSLFMVLCGIILFFVHDKFAMIALLLVISLDAHANVVLFDCPLSGLEKKYLGTSMIESRVHVLQHLGIMYSNNKCYDTQLEVIINAWILTAGKLLFLVIFDYYGIKYK
jgi:hypothetical protein